MKLSKLLLILPCYLLTSCGKFSTTYDDDFFIEEQIKKITHIMKENDADELFSYFAKSVQDETPTLRDDIVKLCEFYTGGDFVEWYSGGNSVGTNESRDNRKVVKSLTSRSKFKAESNNYFIQMSWRTKDSYNSDNVGIRFFFIAEFADGEEPVTTFEHNGEVIFINGHN